MTKSFRRKGLIYLTALSMVFSFAIAASTAFAAAVPELIVTQVVGNTEDSTNALDSSKSLDGYELVEIYNTTNKPINLKNYSMNYVYVKSKDDIFAEANQVWPLGDKTIAPGGFMYVWVKQYSKAEGKASNPNKVADFAKYWGIKADLVIVTPQSGEETSGGISNSGERIIAIGKDGKTEIARAVFNDSGSDFDEKMSAVYGVPSDGSTTLVKLGSKQKVVLGKIREGQAPVQAQAPASDKASDPVVPKEMPKTGMGGTMPVEQSDSLIYVAGVVMAAAAGSVVFVLRRKAQKQ